MSSASPKLVAGPAAVAVPPISSDSSTGGNFTSKLTTLQRYSKSPNFLMITMIMINAENVKNGTDIVQIHD